LAELPFSQGESRVVRPNERVFLIVPFREFLLPGSDKVEDLRNIEALVFLWVFREVVFSKGKEAVRGFEPVLLEMDERAGELNQAFVKVTMRPFAIRKPEFFEDIVGFVIELLIEEHEIAEIMGIEFVSSAAFDQGGNLCAFVAHWLG
jgi:hypothetical protein